MAGTKFQGNRFRIDGEIDGKHALQIYQNNCIYYDIIRLTYLVISFEDEDYFDIYIQKKRIVQLFYDMLYSLTLKITFGYENLKIIDKSINTQ